MKEKRFEEWREKNPCEYRKPYGSDCSCICVCDKLAWNELAASYKPLIEAYKEMLTVLGVHMDESCEWKRWSEALKDVTDEG